MKERIPFKLNGEMAQQFVDDMETAALMEDEAYDLHHVIKTPANRPGLADRKAKGRTVHGTGIRQVLSRSG